MLKSLFVKGNGCDCLIVFHMCLAASVTHLFLGLPTFLLRGSFGSIEFLLNVVCFTGLLLFCLSIRVYLFALLSWYATANGLTFFGILFVGSPIHFFVGVAPVYECGFHFQDFS